MTKTVRVCVLVCLVISSSCSKDDTSPPTTRSYEMGMANSAPRYDDPNLVLQTLEMWTTRAEAAIISTSVPWDSLYAGVTCQNYVLRNYLPLVNYYRSKNLKLWVYIDPANGLNRASDDDQLVAMGKSITDEEVQVKYRRFIVVMDSMLTPDHLGLALETNLIRTSSSSLYNGIKQATNNAAADVRATGSVVKLGVSVHAEMAWGKTPLTPDGKYVGIAQDLTDFPFLQEIGVSSYPYFSFSTPTDLPDDYYSRLVAGTNFSLFISEGGWTSESFVQGAVQITSSPELQRQYIVRQGELLAAAPSLALFQLTFTDLDIDAIPDGANLAPFAFLGLVDQSLAPRPSLGAWDGLYKLKLVTK